MTLKASRHATWHQCAEERKTVLQAGREINSNEDVDLKKNGGEDDHDT